ncbi:MAG: TIGR01459 family HAD-type hydrolase [Dongiaceae bacterium]
MAAQSSPMAPGQSQTIAGLQEIAGAYDVYLLDLWGVLHNGVRAFPAAIAALRELKAAGKRVGILSNGPRRASAVAERSAELGITPDLYDVIHSSGEETWLALSRRGDGRGAGLGRRALAIVPPKDRSLLAGLDLDWTGDPAVADFALLSGTDGPAETVADYEPLLRQLRARNLPLICANPDLVVVRGDIREICAGAIAARYEALGGKVHYFGKPHPEVYERCLAALGSPPHGRILAVGDSLRTDIAGATRAGIDSLFILGGIHGAELICGNSLDLPAFAALCRREGATPRYLSGELCW